MPEIKTRFMHFPRMMPIGSVLKARLSGSRRRSSSRHSGFPPESGVVFSAKYGFQVLFAVR
jgi:hypothetical protein